MPRSLIYRLRQLLLVITILCFSVFSFSPANAADIQAVLDTTDGSSGMVIQDSANTPRMRVLSNGNVGINTVTPKGTLEIIRSGTVTPVVVSSSAATPGDILSITNAGNIGIGTVGASSRLHVNTGTNQNLRVRPGTDFTSNNGIALQSLNDAANTLQQLTFRSSDVLMDVTGNVGIGTVTPQGKLAVSGNVGIGTWAPQGMLEVRGGPVRIGTGTVNNATQDGDLYVARNLEVDGNVWLGDATTDNLTVTGHFSQTGETDFETIEIKNNAFVGTQGGNLGVGTTAARSSIEVLRTATNPLLKLSSTVAGNGDYMIVDGLGNVGVGTTTPQGAMVVTSGNVGIGTWAPRLALDVGGSGVRIGNGVFNNPTGNGDLYVTGNMEVDGSVWLGDAAADNFTVTGTFIQTGDSSITGNFGVGTTTPQTKLAVLGSVGIGTWTQQGAGLSVMNGNIGVGSMAPGQGVDVIGGVRTTTGFTTGGGYTQSGVGVNTLTGATNVSGVATFSNATNSALFTGGNVGVGTVTPQGALTVMSGNVGIGTWAPRTSLEVEGPGVRLGNGTFNNPSGNADLYVTGNMEVDGSVWLGDAGVDNLTVTGTFAQNGDFNVSGNFGVGTTTPQTKIAILGPVGVGTWTTPDGGMAVMNGNVGIGTMIPGQAVDVIGGVRTTTGFTTGGGYTQSGSSTNTFSGVSNFGNNVGIGTNAAQGTLVVAYGNVGIGTWAPTAGLEVRSGAARFGSGTVNFATGEGDVYVANNLEVDGSVWLGDASMDNLTVTGTFAQTGDSSVSGNFGVGTTTPQTKLAVLGSVGIGTWTEPNGALGIMNGNVGVGTMNPGQALDVVGTVRSSTGVITSGGYTQSGVGVNTLTGATNVSGIATFSNATASALFTGGNVGIGTETPQGAFTVTSGNVGLGTWAPTAGLEVRNGAVRVGTGTVDHIAGEGDLYVARNLEVDGDVWLGDAGIDNLTVTGTFIQSGDSSISGNFGVGTSTPQTKLAVLGSVGIGTWTNPSGGLAVMNGNVGVGTMVPGQAIDVEGAVRTTTGFNTSGGYIQTGTSANRFTGLSSFNNNVGIGTTTPQGALAITSGNVGIGTVSPRLTLDVEGQGVRIGNGAFDNPSGNADLYVTGNLEVDGSVWLGDAAADNFTVTGTFVQAGDSSITGNFGIGTSTPQTKLAVLGPVGIGTWTTPEGGMAIMNGNVGVGTMVPGQALDVIGGVRSTTGFSTSGGYIQTGSDANAFSGISSFNNNVGIGTSTPQGAFTVTSGNVGIGTWVPTQALDVNGTVRSNAFATTGGYTQSGVSSNLLTGATSINNNVGVGTMAAQTAFAVVNGNVGIGTWTAAGGNLIVKGGGNVGINTAWPGTAVDVIGTVRATAFVGDGTGIVGVSAFPSGGLNAVQYGDGVATLGDETKFSFNGNNVGIGTTDGISMLDVRGNVYTSGNVGIGTSTPQVALAVTSGNVGIGTWTAAEALDVNGTIKSNAFLTSGGYTQSGSSANTFTGVTSYSNNVGIGTNTPQGAFTVTSGNVGIGTWVPTQALDVNGTVRSNAFATTGGYTQTGSSTNTLSGATTINNNVGIGTAAAQTAFAITNGNVGIGTWTAAGGNLIVNGGGNVGINTVWPGAEMDVQGTVRATLFVGNGGGITGINAVPAGGLNAVQFNDGSPVTAGSETALSFNGTNLGVGTTNGLARLDVRGVVSSTGNVVTTGNVGIGTTTPQTGLAVTNGNIGVGTWTAANAVSVSNGSVAIGSSNYVNTPLAPGRLAVEGAFGIGTHTPAYVFEFNSAGNYYFHNGGQAGIYGDANGVNFFSASSPMNGQVSVNGRMTVGSTFGAPTNGLYVAGNVGMGTTLNTNNLDVKGGVGIGSTYAGYYTATSNGVIIEGNVGIGTFAPVQALEVAGTIKSNAFSTTGGYTQTGTSANTITGTTTFNNATASALFTGGNVGVGSVTPGTKVDVQGTVRATAFVGDGTGIVGVSAFPSGGLNAVQYGDGVATLGDESKFSFDGTNVGIGTSNGVTMLDVRGNVSTTGNIGIGTNTPQGALTVTSGNVGIGTWAPSYALQVFSNAAAPQTLFDSAAITRIGINSPTNAGFALFVANDLKWSNATVNYSGTASDPDYVIFNDKTNTSALVIDGTTNNVGIGTSTPQGAFTVTSGNVGIGTWAPSQLLDVLGTVKANAFSTTGGYTQTGTSANTITGTTTFNNATASALFTGGNVGVGSVTPGTKVDVQGTVRATAFVGDGTGIVGVSAFPSGGLNAVQYGDGVATLGDETLFSFNGANVGIGTTNGVAMLDVRGNIYGAANVGIGTSTPQASLVVTNGNVGIGTWTAARNLDVVGDARISGNVEINLQ